jgi:N-acetylneuraminic acid mutarotase
MLTKKYFNDIANIINNSKNKDAIIKNLSNYFSSENPNFNEEKFIKACNKEE